MKNLSGVFDRVVKASHELKPGNRVYRQFVDRAGILQTFYSREEYIEYAEGLEEIKMQ